MYSFVFCLVTVGRKCNDHIIIGTPGSLLDWIMRYKAFDPQKISVFVLDEADVMISQQGHQDQSIRIKKYVKFLCFNGKGTILLY